MKSSKENEKIYQIDFSEEEVDLILEAMQSTEKIYKENRNAEEIKMFNKTLKLFKDSKKKLNKMKMK